MLDWRVAFSKITVQWDACYGTNEEVRMSCICSFFLKKKKETSVTLNRNMIEHCTVCCGLLYICVSRWILKWADVLAMRAECTAMKNHVVPFPTLKTILLRSCVLVRPVRTSPGHQTKETWLFCEMWCG